MWVMWGLCLEPGLRRGGFGVENFGFGLEEFRLRTPEPENEEPSLDALQCYSISSSTTGPPKVQTFYKIELIYKVKKFKVPPFTTEVAGQGVCRSLVLILVQARLRVCMALP